MPYSRQRPRIAPTGRVTVRLTPEQRDMFIQSANTPKSLAQTLHRAAVRGGKLTVRVDRASLDALIAVAAKAPAADRDAERSLAALVRYLETLEESFAEPDEETEQD